VLAAITAADPEAARSFRSHTKWVPGRSLFDELMMTSAVVVQAAERAMAQRGGAA